MKRASLVLAVLAAVALSSSFAFAERGMSHDQCPLAKMHGYGKDKDEEYKCKITEKLIDKAKFFLKNADEIGLTEEQVNTIKAIKSQAKKSNIRAEADMKVFEMDLKDKLSESTLDLEGLNAMIDKSAEGWKESAKAMVSDYAKLKAVLSDEQMKKAKEIWKRNN
jgi:hypothetical protein